MKTLKINKNPLFGWGDTHGNWRFLEQHLHKFDVTNANFLQVGDFGIGYKLLEEEELYDLNQTLKCRNVFLYVIRGNHDNPFYFKGMHLDWYSNIFFLEDYTIIQWKDKNILCIGGAISIDRKKSQRRGMLDGRQYWWHNEGFNYDEGLVKQILDEYYIDIVATHNCPSDFPPVGYSQIVYDFAKEDDKLIGDLDKERSDYDKLLKLLHEHSQPKLWLYGHHHFSETTINFITKTKLLGIDEIYPVRID